MARVLLLPFAVNVKLNLSVVLNNFSCSISVFLILKRGVAIFSEPEGCSSLAYNLNCNRNNPPRPLTFTEPFPVSDRTFPLKLSSRSNRKLQVLGSQSEKDKLLFFVMLPK